MKKRILSVFLAICMVMAFMPITAMATQTHTSGSCGKTENDNVTWSFDQTTGTLTIGGTGRMSDFTVTTTVDGDTITVGDYDTRPWKPLVSNIKSVVIEEGVTSIGSSAFTNCTEMTSVTIPDSVTSIGENAFINCTEMTSVTIPNNVTSIGDFAFSFCRKLAKIDIPNGIIDIGEYSFYGCHALTTVTFKGDVDNIGSYVFNGFCNLLTNVYFFGNVSSINQYAFNKNYSDNLKLFGYTDNATVQTYAKDYGFTFVALNGDCGMTENDKVKWKFTSDGTLTISGSGDVADYSATDAPWKTLVDEGVIKQIVIHPDITYTSLGLTPKYTVTFKDGDTVCNTQMFFTDDSTVTELADPIKDGLTFIGWYEKENGTFKANAFDFKNTTVTDDITLYAKWLCTGEHTDTNPKDHICDVCSYEISTHSGGTATCTQKAVCTYCGKFDEEALGHTDKDKDHICDRENCKATISTCTGGTATCTQKAVCEYCGKSYGNLDTSNHTGETEVKNSKAATCTEDGYTGDTYCKGCGEKISSGSIITKLGHTDKDKDHVCDRENCGETTSLHTYKWQSKDGQYWQKCSYCGDETEKSYVPRFEIKGADTVCDSHDYKFTFTLPEGTTGVVCGYDTSNRGDSYITPEYADGVYSATISSDTLSDETLITIYVIAKTAEGYEFSATKEIKIVNGHTGGTSDCTHKAVCEVCGDEYGEENATNHTALKHFEAKEATTETEGNIEYWYCEDCGKYFSDEEGSIEIQPADTVIEKLAKTGDNSETPQKETDSHMILWIALIVVGGGALIGIVICGKKKKHSEK